MALNDRYEQPYGRIACSTGTMPRAYGRRYHELSAVFQAMADIPVRNVEIVIHPDWRPEPRPRTDQPDPWEASAKWTASELLAALQRGFADANGTALSIHANRDIGMFLGSPDRGDRQLGEKLLRDHCHLALALGVEVIVIHAWDTWAESINVPRTAELLNRVAAEFSDLTLTIENVPVSTPNQSQEAIVGHFFEVLERGVGLTLDLSWSSLYNNLPALLEFAPRLYNVHVQGRLRRGGDGGTTWFEPRAGELRFRGAIQDILATGYRGQWTLELNRAVSLDDFRDALRHLHAILTG